MLNEYNAALGGYAQNWQALLAGRKNQEFFASLKPTAIGWKVADRAEYDTRLQALHDQAGQIIETWMNERWVAKVHLRDTVLSNGVSIIKLMQRRPGSADAVGLDHIDFYSPIDLAVSKEILRAEPELQWTLESNDIVEGYDWLSVWFAGTEAKIKSDTVLDIIQVELAQLNKTIVGNK